MCRHSKLPSLKASGNLKRMAAAACVNVAVSAVLTASSELCGVSTLQWASTSVFETQTESVSGLWGEPVFCWSSGQVDRRLWLLRLIFFFSFFLSCFAVLCSDVWQSPALTFKVFIITLFYFSRPPTRSLGRKVVFFFFPFSIFPPSAVTVNEESVSLIQPR